MIVTGDRKEAALALAREIGALRPGDEAISGEELELLTPEALGACIERYRVCARASAEHKLRIVRAWKQRGRRVAVVGEGVIDAPALREADVGVVFGAGGSEVAREEATVTASRRAVSRRSSRQRSPAAPAARTSSGSRRSCSRRRLA